MKYVDSHSVWVSSEEISEYVDRDKEILDIVVENTCNTWQKNRSQEEILKDMLIGKAGEYALEIFLGESRINFVSYDKVRKDEFKKHAPVDSIIVVSDEAEKHIEEICARERSGATFSVKELAELKKCGGLGVEVKSTRISERHSTHKGKMEKLASELRNREHFLMYPSYCRRISGIFGTEKEFDKIFEENKGAFPPSLLHSEYVSRFFKGKEKSFRNYEYSRMLPIIVRAYVNPDDLSVLLVSWIKSKEFCSLMSVSSLTKENKSENALYSIVKLSCGHSFLDFVSEIEKMKTHLKNTDEQGGGETKSFSPEI